MMSNHKKWHTSEEFFCIELKLCTVVALTTKFHDISTVTFPWQYIFMILKALSNKLIKNFVSYAL